MERPPRGVEADSTGFAYTRRTILKTGGALGVASLLAGCGDQLDGPAPTDEPPTDVTTPADSGTQQVESSDLVADGLEVVSSGITKNNGLPGSDVVGQNAASRSYVRVLVRNTLDYPISAVRLFVETFDEEGRYLDVQSATISSLFPQEVFEGYVPYPFGVQDVFEDIVRDSDSYPLAGAYVIYADRSRRADGGVTVADVELVDHCLDDEGVRGTVRNAGDSSIRRFRVDVRFYDSDGEAIGTGVDTVAELPGGTRTQFEIDLDATFEEAATDVTDYSITVGDYLGDVQTVR